MDSGKIFKVCFAVALSMHVMWVACQCVLITSGGTVEVAILDSTWRGVIQRVSDMVCSGFRLAELHTHTPKPQIETKVSAEACSGVHVEACNRESRTEQRECVVVAVCLSGNVLCR